MQNIGIFFSIISLFFASFAHTARAQTGSDRETDQIKQDLSRLYTVPARKITVELKNGRKQKGYINEMDTETFTFVNAKNGTRNEIRYADVARANRTGMSQNQKTILVAAGIGTLITVGIIFRPKAKPGLRCLLCN